MTSSDDFIYHEMMTHPALFTHPHPQKVAILGNQAWGVLDEVLKHSTLSEICHVEKKSLPNQGIAHHRVTFHLDDYAKWIAESPAHFFDVIIVNTPDHSASFLRDCCLALSPEGVLIQTVENPFDFSLLRTLHDKFQAAGFSDNHPLHFPEPSGWRFAWIATRRTVLRRASEKAIFNKVFKTRYYNFDVHKAALSLPEFMREELIF